MRLKRHTHHGGTGNSKKRGNAEKAEKEEKTDFKTLQRFLSSVLIRFYPPFPLFLRSIGFEFAVFPKNRL